MIAGKPLCAWCIEEALQVAQIQGVFVSTDSSEIKRVVQAIDSRIRVIDRPPELATDEASTESVMKHFASLVDFENLITLQATSPLLTASDLEKAIDIFLGNGCDSLVTGVRCKRFFWHDNGLPINYEPIKRPRRQEFKGTFMENGAFYITRRQVLDELGCRLGGKVGMYEMDECNAIEIDEPADWDVVEKLLLKYKGKKNDH